MMTRSLPTPIAALAALVMLTSPARAQDTSPRTSADSAYARARQLVVSGNGAAGRLLVDSMVAATPPDTPEYADALYWRASLASATTEAERDYRRIVVEYRLSPRSGDALLRLAQLEVARADRPGATAHLQRFLLENPDRPERGRVGYLLTRVLFEQNEPVRGCIALGRARRDVPRDSIELLNQLEYFAPRCEGVDTVAAQRAADTASAARATADSARARGGTVRADSTTPAKKAAPRGPFTVQVAAYGTRAAANALAARLKSRGFESRVAGASKPFRVRIGYYDSRAAAAAAVKRVAARGIKAVVTETSDER
jgi:cell division septation protein DedD